MPKQNIIKLYARIWLYDYFESYTYVSLVIIGRKSVICYDLSCTDKYDLKSLRNSSLPLSRYGKLRSENVWLFNIKQDPSEQNDLSSTKLYRVKMLLDRIDMYKRSAVKPQAEGNDLQCDPSRNGYAWKPWVEDV